MDGLRDWLAHNSWLLLVAIIGLCLLAVYCHRNPDCTVCQFMDGFDG